MNVEQLWDTTMNPTKRMLKLRSKIAIIDLCFSRLMRAM